MSDWIKIERYYIIDLISQNSADVLQSYDQEKPHSILDGSTQRIDSLPPKNPGRKLRTRDFPKIDVDL